MEQFDNYYRISELVLRYLKEEISEAEKTELEAWLQESDGNRDLFAKLVNPDYINPELIMFSENDRDQAWKNIQSATATGAPVVAIRKDGGKLLRYAAAIIFVLASVSLLVYNLNTDQQNDRNPGTGNDVIAPAGNKATLTLADGTQVLLDEAHSGELARQQHAIVRKTAEGQLVYDLTQVADNGLSADSEPVFNTITTPKGGQYQLILPDGTKVWLNAMSSLRFPVHFHGGKRVAELSGEAYFMVKKNETLPFTVSARGVDVNVLGTRFNISAYENENGVYTTLADGSVKVAAGDKETVLIPGMQAVYKNGEINVIPADVGDITAWKDGYFLFRNEPIERLMTTISRWYDIEVDYQGNLEGKVFGGKFSMNSSLSELLKSLELTGTVTFKTKGRRVTVMP